MDLGEVESDSRAVGILVRLLDLVSTLLVHILGVCGLLVGLLLLLLGLGFDFGCLVGFGIFFVHMV